MIKVQLPGILIIKTVSDKAHGKAASESDAWKAENAEKIAALNKYVEENGLPLAKWRAG